MLNKIRCDKLSTAVAAVRAHPDKCEKDFDVVVAFLEQKMIELMKNSREEYDSMSMEQHQQLYCLWKKAVLIKGKNTP